MAARVVTQNLIRDPDFLTPVNTPLGWTISGASDLAPNLRPLPIVA